MKARSLTANLEPHQRIIAAWDIPSFGPDEKKAAEEIHPYVSLHKIGLQAFFAYDPDSGSTVGLQLYNHIINLGGDVMADVKGLDILNTMKGLSQSLAWWPHPPKIMTIHATVRLPSIIAALEAVREARILVAGVTVLTDHNHEEAAEIYNRSITETVLNCAAKLSTASKQVGSPIAIVSSPQELGLLGTRDELDDLIRITPSIRPPDSAPDDQARTMTPGDAILAGADYLVIGRPITQAKNKVASAQAIAADIAKALEL